MPIYCITKNYFYLSNGWVGNNGFYQFHYYYILRVGYGLRDRTDELKNPTLHSLWISFYEILRS